MMPNRTVALAAYAVVVAGAAFLFAWQRARAFDYAVGAGVADAADAADALAAAAAAARLERAKQNAFDEHATHALWTLYQPLLPPLLMWWLWCRAVHRYARRSVPYALCYPRADRAALPTAAALALGAARASALAATAFAASVTLLAMGGPVVDAAALYAVPITLYAGFLGWLLWPPAGAAAAAAAATAASSKSGGGAGGTHPPPLTPRLLLRRTLLRALFPGALAPVGWADFYLADCLTSLSKSSLDLERAACASLGAGPLRLRPSHLSASRGACGASSPPALLALCLPFFLRLCQCLSVYARARRREGPSSARADRTPLYNAGKYALAAAAAALTQLEHEHHVHSEPFPWRRLWIGASVLSASFAWFWDAQMDWGVDLKREWWSGAAAARGRRGGGGGKAGGGGKGGGKQGASAGGRGKGAAWGSLLPSSTSSTSQQGARRPGSASGKSLSASSAGGGGGGGGGGSGGGPGIGGGLAARQQQQQQHQQLNFPLMLATNALLRFSWAHRLAGDLEAHSAVQMAVALLEVARRHRWGHGRHALELAHRAAARARERGRRRAQRALLLPPGDGRGGGGGDGGVGRDGGRSSSSSSDGGGGGGGIGGGGSGSEDADAEGDSDDDENGGENDGAGDARC